MLLFPLLLVVSSVILITAGWPVFYTQNRYGQNKKVFKILKLRTMYVGAEKNQWRYREDNMAPEPMYKNWYDPRFVGVGRWLSKTGVDELPQLINIAKGEMSLVGPRPLPVYEAKELPADWDFRSEVKPGVFSEWSATRGQADTLAAWKKLERQTLRRGGLNYELSVIKNTLINLF